MTADLTNPIFTDETKAREYLESVRWPDGPFCPHCGEAENVKRLHGKSHRPGLHQCNSCRQHFTVTVGTLYERSHIPLHKWLLATHLMASSKKGISAHQLHRMLGITYKSAWFMAHRIREAMKDENPGPLGGEGKVVEADETYIGPKRYRLKNGKGWKPIKGHSGKWKVLTLVERNGKARSVKIEKLNTATIWQVATRVADRKSTLITDELRMRLLGIAPWATTSPATARSTTPRASTPAAPSTPTRSRAISRSSNAACAASTSTAASSTYSAI